MARLGTPGRDVTVASPRSAAEADSEADKAAHRSTACDAARVMG